MIDAVCHIIVAHVDVFRPGFSRDLGPDAVLDVYYPPAKTGITVVSESWPSPCRMGLRPVVWDIKIMSGYSIVLYC